VVVVRHEACRFSTLILKWISVDLLEFAYYSMWLSTDSEIQAYG